MRPLSPIWEVAGYGGLFLLGLGLRLGGLEGRPLAPKEAEVAYAAWRLVGGAPLASTPSPLALDVAAASFFLLGASDLAARLGSALLGSLIVPALALFRRELSASGGWGALGAAALAATSPTLIHSSRSLSSAALALLLSVIGASLLLRLGRGVEESPWRQRWAFWGLSIVAGLLLNGGALGLGFVLVGVLFITLQIGFGLSRGFPRPLAWHGAVGVGIVLATFYLAATTLGVNWPGVGLASLGEWNDALAGPPEAGMWGGVGGLLWASYEPLSLFLGLWGLGRWVKEGRGDLAGVKGLAALWGGVGLALLLVGDAALFAPFLALPLILWGGPVLASWVARMSAMRWGPGAGYYLLALAGLVLSFMVTNWLTLPGNASPAYYWLLVLVGLAPALLLVALLVRGRVAPSLAWAFGLGTLLALTVHSGTALNYGEAAAEPLGAAAGPLDIRDALVGVTRRAGNPYWWTGAEIQLDQAVVQPWLWYLREYPHVLVVEEAQGSPAVAIAAPGKAGSLSGYRKGGGQLWTRGRGPEDGAGAWWRWFVFRQPVGPPAAGGFEILFRE